MAGISRDLFRGKLVRLAAPAVGDAETLARWTEDDGYLRSMDTDYARPVSAQELSKRLNREAPHPNVFEFHLRTLEDDRLIGFVALHSIEWNNQAALLAIGIGEPAYRGRGYGTDALFLVLQYGFEELNLHRVGLSVIANNARAIRSYEKIGFRREGALRGAVSRDGSRHDVLLMGMLKDEWDTEKEKRA